MIGEIPEVNSNQAIGPSTRWRVNEFICPETFSWKARSVQERFVWADACSILEMEIPKEGVEDFRYWKHTNWGRFTIKPSYEHLRKGIVDDSRKFEDQGLSFIRLI